MGAIEAESGFEDVVYHSGVGSSGSLLGVLSGSHYNRCWTVHNAVSETLERLLLSIFMRNHAAPIVLSSSAAFPQLYMPLDEECIQFNQTYEQFR